MTSHQKKELYQLVYNLLEVDGDCYRCKHWQKKIVCRRCEYENKFKISKDADDELKEIVKQIEVIMK